MRRTDVGRYAVSVAGSESVRAFVPAPLPPVPSLHLEGTVRDALDQAVLSSQIEGTQSTLDDLLAHELGEAPGVPLADVAEVSRYVAAVTHGLQRLRDGFPLSNRLLREMHAVAAGLCVSDRVEPDL